MKPGCCIGRILVWTLACVLVAGVALFLASRPADRILGRWSQPDSIEYSGGLRIHVRLIEREADLRGFPMYLGRKYYIFAGADSSATYGHLWPVDLYTTGGTVEAAASACTVEWSDSGFVFSTGSGHRVFVPQTMFTGGR
jgi:hypothetical protein